MKICVIGDPHGNLEKIKKINLKQVDLILLTGDLGSANLMREMHFDNIKRIKKGLPKLEYSKNQRKKAYMEAYNSTIKIIKYLSKFAPTYTIYGNVEYSTKETRKLSKELNMELPILSKKLNKMNNVRIINNKIANFKGIRIGGLEYFTDVNWVKEFKPSNFKENLLQAKKETIKAKKILKWFNKVDILITHQPPYKILDKVTSDFAPKQWKNKHAGSEVILKYINSKQPKYHFCGHIHEGEGNKTIKSTKIFNLGVANHKIINL